MQNVVAHVVFNQINCVTPFHISFYWLPVASCMLKSFMIACRKMNERTPTAQTSGPLYTSKHKAYKVL